VFAFCCSGLQWMAEKVGHVEVLPLPQFVWSAALGSKSATASALSLWSTAENHASVACSGDCFVGGGSVGDEETAGRVGPQPRTQSAMARSAVSIPALLVVMARGHCMLKGPPRVIRGAGGPARPELGRLLRWHRGGRDNGDFLSGTKAYQWLGTPPTGPGSR
jgi:hypothetical protein